MSTSGDGEEVGKAKGTIEIDATQTAKAAQQVTAAANSMATSMEKVDSATKRTASEWRALGAAARVALTNAQQELAKVRGEEERLSISAKANAAGRLELSRRVTNQQKEDARKATRDAIEDGRRVTQRQKADLDTRLTATRAFYANTTTLQRRDAQIAVNDARNIATQTTNAQRHAQNLVIQGMKAQTVASNNLTRVQLQNLRAVQAQQQQNAAFAQRSALSAQNFQQRQALLTQRQQAGGGGGGGLGQLLGGFMRGGIGGLAGAAIGGGVGLLAAQVVGQIGQQIAQNVQQSEELITSYNRQMVAARSLAGGTTNLNQMLEAYQEAAGGAVDKSTALANTTSLMAIGMAKNAQEMERFTRVARGISIAMGKPVSEITQEIALATANMSTRRLDQIGLGVAEVSEKMQELREANRDLTREQAFGQAILDVAEQKYGEVTRAQEAQATGLERLQASWKDFGLAMADLTHGPLDALLNKLADITEAAADSAAGVAEATKTEPQDKMRAPVAGGIPGTTSLAIAQEVKRRAEEEIARLKEQAAILQSTAQGIEQYNMMLQGQQLILDEANRSIAAFKGQIFTERADGPPDANMSRHHLRAGGIPLSPEQQDVAAAWWQRRAAIEEDAMRRGLDEIHAYEDQRADTIADYEQRIAHEAEDFARQRARRQEDFQRQINELAEEGVERELEAAADLARQRERQGRDLGRQEARWRRDLAKAIAEAGEEAGKRENELNEDFAKKQEKSRSDANERMLEMEQSFQEEREKAGRQHTLTLNNAAARLDANAVFEEQQRYALEQEEANKAHAKAMDKERENLDETLQEQQTAHDEQITDLHEALAEQTAEMNEAHEERVADAREALAQQLADQEADSALRLAEQKRADAERLQEMIDANARQIAQEDIDRGIRLSREAEQHGKQLQELDDQHTKRMQQIAEHAQDEREENDKNLEDELDELGLRSAKRASEEAKMYDDSYKAFQKYWASVMQTMGIDTPLPDVNTSHPELQARRNTAANRLNELQSQRSRTNDPGERARLDAKIAEYELQITELDRLIGGGGGGGGVGGDDNRDRSSDEISATSTFLSQGTGDIAGIAGMAGSGGGSAGGGGGMSITVDAGAIVVYGAPGQSALDIAQAVRQNVVEFFEEVAGAYQR